MKMLTRTAARRTAAAAAGRCSARADADKGVARRAACASRGLPGPAGRGRFAALVRAESEDAPEEPKNIEVVTSEEDDFGFDEEDGADGGLESVVYKLDKSASVASLMDALSQQIGSFDPSMAPTKQVDDDPEKQADALRKELQREGLEERLIEIRRVTKVVKGGNILSFRAVVAVGDKKGRIGVGVAKGKEVMVATSKAVSDARNNIVRFPLTKSGTIPHTAIGRATSAQVIIKPAGEGTGVTAGGATRSVLELAGVANVLSKQLGSDSLLNNARATVNALNSLRSPAEVAKLRGKTVRQMFGLDPGTKTMETVAVDDARFAELVDACDMKTKSEIAEALAFLERKGLKPEAAEAKLVQN